MSESSEDNESNTSPKDQEESCDSSYPVLTSSDPTNSDSSEENGEKEEPMVAGKAASGDAPLVSSGKGSLSGNGGCGKEHNQIQQQKCYTKAKSKNKPKAKEKQSDADSGILSIISQAVNSDGKSVST
jgi:hypothetical protein